MGSTGGKLVGGAARGIVKAGRAVTRGISSLFTGPTQTIVGPRLDNFDIQQADEGDPIARCFGSAIRVNGTVIWAGSLEEAANSRKVRSKGGSVREIEFSNFISVAIGICEGPISSVKKVFADSKLFYDVADSGGGAQRYDALYFHTGELGQAPDPLIQAAQGANETPGFSGLAYMVVERLNLGDFGGRLPIFSFEIDAGASTVGQAVAVILEDVGVTSDRYDVSGATKVLRGMLLNGPEQASSTIERLTDSHELRAKETDGVLEFFHAGSEDVRSVAPEDLGARQGGSSAERRLLEIRDVADEDLPREVNVQYYDGENEFNKGSIRARRALNVGVDREELNLPVVLTAREAREVAERRLWQAWNERQPARIELPPAYLDVEETDILEVSVEGTKYRLRVLAVTRGFNFLAEVEAVVQSTSVDETVDPPFLIIVNPPADPADPFFQTLYSPPTLVAHVLDLPALRPQEVRLVGFIYGHTTSNVADEFLGVDYFERFGTTVDFTFLFRDNDLSIIGFAVDALEAPQNPHHWDEANEVTVELFRSGQELSSAQDKLSVLQGLNWALLGDEIIGFRQASLVGERRWRLSGLIRGQRDTFDHCDSHSPGERFVLLSSVTYQELAMSDVGAAREMKVVPEGEDVDNVSEFAFTPQGESLRPFRPTHVTGSRDGGGDLTIAWIPRTREFYRPLSVVPFPPLEMEERFEVDVLDGSSVVRTLVAVAASAGAIASVVYTAAQQTADFGSPQSSVDVVVYKISSAAGVGRGNSQEATV